MKRVVMPLVFAFLFIGVASQLHAAPNLSLSSESIVWGETKIVELSLSGGTESYAGVNARILTPAGVSIAGVEEGGLLSGGDFTVDFHPFSEGETNGATVIAYSDVSTVNESSGVLLLLTLTAANDAAVGSHPISFATTNPNPLINAKYALSNADGTVSVSLNTEDGSIAVIAPTPLGSISGQVTTLVGGQPQGLEGATVVVAGTGISAVTDASGYYTIEDIPVGTHTIRIQKDGYQPVEVSGVTVLEGQVIPVTSPPMPACNPPEWIPVVYTNSTTVYGVVTLDGEPASEGDRVAAFVDGECRGVQEVVINEGTAYVTLIINGETPQETAEFKIFDADECAVLDVSGITLSTIPGGVIGLPPDYFEIAYLSVVDQNIALNAGWNLISINVEPDDNSPPLIFEPVLDNLGEVKDTSKSYNPDVPDFLNTLKEILPGYGYWAKVDAAVDLTITGPPADCSMDIDISSGWNLAGYPCQAEQPVTDAFGSIVDILVEVKDTIRSYNPDVPDFLNTLKTIVPGSGYWVNVSSPTTFNYPMPSDSTSSTSGISSLATGRSPFAAPGWTPVTYTNSTTAYGIVTIGGQPASEGDLVGAFVDGECRAVQQVITNQGTAYVTLLINGEVAQETVSFRVYDVDADTVHEVSNTYLSAPGSMIGIPPNYLDIAGVSATTLSGNVVVDFAGHSGLSVINATISLVGTDKTTQTDSDGNFELELTGIPSGSYDLIITRDGLETHKQQIDIFDGPNSVPDPITMTPKNWDANSDGKIGLEEAIRALQIVSGAITP